MKTPSRQGGVFLFAGRKHGNTEETINTKKEDGQKEGRAEEGHTEEKTNARTGVHFKRTKKINTIEERSSVAI